MQAVKPMLTDMALALRTLIRFGRHAVRRIADVSARAPVPAAWPDSKNRAQEHA